MYDGKCLARSHPNLNHYKQMACGTEQRLPIKASIQPAEFRPTFVNCLGITRDKAYWYVWNRVLLPRDQALTRLKRLPSYVRGALKRTLFIEHDAHGNLRQEFGHLFLVLHGSEEARIFQQRQNLYGDAAGYV
jgi:hypothetical protein